MDNARAILYVRNTARKTTGTPPAHGHWLERFAMKVRLLAAVALIATTALTGSAPAHAATSDTPVWIGAGYAGKYMTHTQPGVHGGNQVSFDFYARAGTRVKIYAAPKNTALNSRITAHIIASDAGSRYGTKNAAACGFYAVVEIRHSGNKIGRVTFSHLASKARIGTISRWGGTVGTIAKLPYNQPNRTGACYVVSNPNGEHTHIEFRSDGSRPACAHRWGAVSIPAGRYQGYIGNYGKAPLSGNRCPSGI